MFESFLTSVMLVALAVGGAALYWFMTNYEKKIEKVFRASALASGGEYWKGLARETALKSILLDQNLHTYIRHMIRYPDDTQLGEAHFTVGKATILFNFASAPLSKFPSLWLIVDSRHNNPLGRSLMDTVDASVKLESIVLEGDFPSSYKVYMNKGEQIAALTALNPASMQTLMHLFDTYDMEICNNRVYLYTVGTTAFYKPETHKQMMQDIKQLAILLG